MISIERINVCKYKNEDENCKIGLVCPLIQTNGSEMSHLLTVRITKCNITFLALTTKLIKYNTYNFCYNSTILYYTNHHISNHMEKYYAI